MRSELPISTAIGASVIVTQGKVVDGINGKLRNETPEEYVRQEIEKPIVRDYQYPRGKIISSMFILPGQVHLSTEAE